MKKLILLSFVALLAGCNSTLHIQAFNSRSNQQEGENLAEQAMEGGADIKAALK